MAKLTEEQYKALSNKDIYNNYIMSIINRLSISSINELNNISKEKVVDIGTAFRLLLNHINDKNENVLNEELIIKVANTINRNQLYISNGYRTYGEVLNGNSNISISKPNDIKAKMQKLLNKYYNDWKKLDIFEREARFNEEFLKIHPFEDGNRRTCRLLLCFNLLRQGEAPAIISAYEKEGYIIELNKSDITYLKNIFKELSDEEANILNNIIKNNYKDNYGNIKK